MAAPFEPRKLFRAKIEKQIFDLHALSASIGMVNDKTLSLVGRDVQQAAKRGIGQTAPAVTKAGRMAAGEGRIVEIDGGLFADRTVGNGRPRPPGKPVKSWAPRRWIYTDISYYLDSTRGTVVIGPHWAPWLNRLHEEGGTETQVAYVAGKEMARRSAAIRRRTGRIPVDSQGRQQVGAVIWTTRKFRGSRSLERTNITRQAKYPKRPFMQGAAGVQKAVAEAAKWFRETFNPRRA